MVKTKNKKPSKVNAIKLTNEIEQLRLKLKKSKIDIPFNTELALKQGNYLLQKGNFEEARKVYKLILKHNPKQVDALIFLGNISDDNHRYQEAIKWYDKALKIDPKNIDALCNKAVSLYNQGNDRKAIKYYDKALKIDKNDEILLYGKSLCLFYLGELKTAISLLDRILKKNPKHADALNLKGACLMNISPSNGKLALKYFNKALKIEPNHYFADPNRDATLAVLGLKSSKYTW